MEMKDLKKNKVMIKEQINREVIDIGNERNAFEEFKEIKRTLEGTVREKKIMNNQVNEQISNL